MAARVPSVTIANPSPTTDLEFCNSGEVEKTGCWFVGGDDLTRALHDL